MEIYDMLPEDMEELLAKLKQPAYRARQIFKWLQAGHAFSEMHNIPKELRAELEEKYGKPPVSVHDKFVSRDGTEKYLFLLRDGSIIEGVYMKYKHGNTLCLSTQAGCRMGCIFCASGLNGLHRNLTPGEMMGQVHCAARGSGEVNNIVLMGSGEPFDNYDNVVRFLRLWNHKLGKASSYRNVSVSTCGLTPKIYDFINEGMPVTLSISLHAPYDDLRARLMPVAAAYPIAGLINACREWIQRTGRRVIFEYALIKNCNSSAQHARALAALLRGLQCHVNIIPLNDVPERGLAGADRGETADFVKTLENANISCTVRRELGADISGACGQLRMTAVREDNT